MQAGLAQKINLLPDTLNVCSGDSSYVEIKQRFDRNTSFNWTTPYSIINNTKKVKALKPGMYYVKISSAQFSSPQLDSAFVKINIKPKPLLRDTQICKGKIMWLDARNSGMRYLWNNGEITQKIKIESGGNYWVKISNGNCSVTDSVYIKTLQTSNVGIANEVSFCLNEENKLLQVKVNPGTKILWSTGATTGGIYINKEGTYWVKSENNQCGSQTDTIKVKLKVCECEMLIPNSFTPNEDNRNDYFFPVLQCEYSYYTLMITDRWGNIVFSTNNVNAKWDGRFKGNLCPEDIYVYRIESTERVTEKKQVRNGHISLFR